MRVLGLDLGAKRIGLALSDEEGRIAFPAGVLERRGRRRDLEALRELAVERAVEQVVVGLPIHMDGRSGPEAEAARTFARELADATALPVDLIDERWTTVEAQRTLREAGPGTARRRGRGAVDAVAASLLLSTWLERRRNRAAAGEVRKALGIALLAGALLGLVAAAAGAFVWQRALAAPGSGAEAHFVVEPGTALRTIAEQLEREGLVREAWAFVALARWREVDDRIHAGEYRLSPRWPAGRVLEELVEGRVVTYEVVIPEGLTAAEIGQRLEDAGLADAEAFLAFADDPASAAALGIEGPTLEGYLFPETYAMPRGLPVERVARVLVEHFLAVWQEIADEAKAEDLSMREVATLASIVEKETGAAHERPLIASVFRNRIARGMKLQSDPTTIYGIADFDGNLRRVHLEDASNPYNTYQIRGLPPTPIANAGADSLRAVVRPADTQYLYFVSRNDGTHVFAKSFAEHDENVDRYQRRGTSR